MTGLAKQGDGFVRGGDIEQPEVLLRTFAQLELARGRRLRAFANPQYPSVTAQCDPQCELTLPAVQIYGGSACPQIRRGLGNARMCPTKNHCYGAALLL